MRLARAWRRRDKIRKFEGAFYGMADHAMMSHTPHHPGNCLADNLPLILIS